MDIRGCPDRTWQLQKYSGPIVKHLHFKGGQLEGGVFANAKEQFLLLLLL